MYSAGTEKEYSLYLYIVYWTLCSLVKLSDPRLNLKKKVLGFFFILCLSLIRLQTKI